MKMLCGNKRWTERIVIQSPNRFCYCSFLSFLSIYSLNFFIWSFVCSISLPLALEHWIRLLDGISCWRIVLLTSLCRSVAILLLVRMNAYSALWLKYEQCCRCRVDVLLACASLVSMLFVPRFVLLNRNSVQRSCHTWEEFLLCVFSFSRFTSQFSVWCGLGFFFWNWFEWVFQSWKALQHLILLCLRVFCCWKFLNSAPGIAKLEWWRLFCFWRFARCVLLWSSFCRLGLFG